MELAQVSILGGSRQTWEPIRRLWRRGDHQRKLAVDSPAHATSRMLRFALICHE